jgi:TonB family protein
MRKALVLAAVFCLCFQAMRVAAATPDFSGSWELDVGKSTLPESMRVEAMTLKVVQTEKDLRIVSITSRSSSNKGERRGGAGLGAAGASDYTLDGKETTADISNDMATGKVTRKAIVASDGKLSLTATSNFETQMGSFTMKTNEIWELLDEGKTLKITRYTESPRGATNAEMYFTKKSSDASTVKSAGDASMSQPNNTGEIPKKISGGILNGKTTSLPLPAYPAAAKAVKASGAVNVQVTFDEQGNVVSATAISGHPLLRAAAEEAARNAKLAPTLLNGIPVAVTGILVYNFTP